MLAIFHHQPLPFGEFDGDGFGAIVGGDSYRAAFITFLNAHPTVGLADLSHTSRGAGFKQLHHSRQTRGDVFASHTTGVEGAHGQLGAWLADGLRGDDAHRFAHIHEFARRERTAVALGAGAHLGFAHQNRAGFHRLDSGSHQAVDEFHRDLIVPVGELGAVGRHHIGGQDPAHRSELHPLGFAQVAQLVSDRDTLVVHLDDRERHPSLGTAVDLANDHVLRHVHEPSGEVTGVGGAQCGVRQTLTRAVRGDEVLQHTQAFPEVRLDRPRDRFTLGVGHQTAHTGDLTHLVHVSARTGLHHLPDRVAGREVVLHRLGDFLRGVRPDLDEFLVELVLREQTTVEGCLLFVGLAFGFGQQFLLRRRGHDVLDGDGHPRTRGPPESEVLERIQHGRNFHLGPTLGQPVHDPAEFALVHLLVDERLVRGHGLVEQRSAQRGVQHEGVPHLPASRCEVAGVVRRCFAEQPQLHWSLQVQLALVVGHGGLRNGGEAASGPNRVRVLGGEVVDAEHHVLGWRGDRAAAGRGQNVVTRKHQHPRLRLRFRAQRQVHSHLVTVEVRVEGGAHQRVNLDRLAFNELRFERLNAEAVQRRRPVEQHRVFGDDLLEHIPHHGPCALHHPLCALDVLRVVEVHEALHDERLEQFKRHLLGQAALVQFELRAHHDHRTTGVVHALAEQVLAEPTLLALEHVGQRLQRPVARTRHRTPAPTVVEQRVDGLLQHPLLVVGHDFRRADVEQPLEPVIAVDHAPVEVVQVAGGEAATVELHHRAQVRRNHRHVVEHHRLRRVGGVQECRDHLEPLEGAGLLLALASGDDLAQVHSLGLKVEVAQPLLNGRRTHVAGEILAEAVPHLPVELFVTDEVLDFEVAEPHEVFVAVEDGVEPLDFLIGPLAALVHFFVGGVAGLLHHRRGGAFGLKRGEVFLQFGHPLVDRVIAALRDRLLLALQPRLQGGKIPVPGFLIHRSDHVGREVDDLLEVLRRQVEQVAQAAGHTLEVPDVGDRGGQTNVAHALAAHLGPRHLHATAFTNDALEAHTLVLAAVALPVPGGAEDLFAEQAVFLRLERAVVDGLGLLDFSERPILDVVGGSQADAEFVEEVDVQHA